MNLSNSNARTWLGVSLSRRTLAEISELLERATNASVSGTQLVIACANPHSIVVASEDEEFREALVAADIVLADGVGMQWGAKISGIRTGPRISGYELFISAMRIAHTARRKVLFFGSRQEVIALILDRCQREFPQAVVQGISPPFGTWTNEDALRHIEQIRDYSPDFLFIGMTAPRQEKWAQANRALIGVPVVASIGAVFEYFAGTIRHAPPAFRRLGLEWAYRLLGEPKRLWRRTFISGPRFLWLAWRLRV